MDRKYIVVMVGLAAVMVFANVLQAEAMFVATAQNLRGALYQGCGPTPAHAVEAAMVQCTQDSFMPRTCKVTGVRAECPPPVCMPPMPQKPIRKASYGGPPHPGYQTWGRPMP